MENKKNSITHDVYSKTIRRINQFLCFTDCSFNTKHLALDSVGLSKNFIKSIILYILSETKKKLY